MPVLPGTENELDAERMNSLLDAIDTVCGECVDNTLDSMDNVCRICPVRHIVEEIDRMAKEKMGAGL